MEICAQGVYTKVKSRHFHVGTMVRKEQGPMRKKCLNCKVKYASQSRKGSYRWPLNTCYIRSGWRGQKGFIKVGYFCTKCETFYPLDAKYI